MTPPAHDFRALADRLREERAADDADTSGMSHVEIDLSCAAELMWCNMDAIQAALSLAANVMDDAAMERAAMGAMMVVNPYAVSTPEYRGAVAQAIKAALLPGDAKGAGV